MPLQPPLLCTWGNKCCSTAKLWKSDIFFSYLLHNSCCKHTKRDRERKREKKKVNVWQKKEQYPIRWTVDHVKSKFFLNLTITRARRLTHAKIPYNVLIMVSSRTGKTLDETVWRDKSALTHCGGVTAENGTDQMSFLSKVTSCRFSPAYCQQRCQRSCIWGAFATGLGGSWCHWCLSLGIYGVCPHFVYTWDSLSLECDTQPSPRDAGTGSSSPATLQKISGNR